MMMLQTAGWGGAGGQEIYANDSDKQAQVEVQDKRDRV